MDTVAPSCFSRKAFSLVELLVFLATFSVLVATAIPSFFAYRQRAKVAEVPHYLKSLTEAQIAFYLRKEKATATEESCFLGFFSPLSNYPPAAQTRKLLSGFERLTPTQDKFLKQELSLEDLNQEVYFTYGLGGPEAIHEFSDASRSSYFSSFVTPPPGVCLQVSVSSRPGEQYFSLWSGGPVEESQSVAYLYASGDLDGDRIYSHYLRPLHIQNKIPSAGSIISIRGGE